MKVIIVPKSDRCNCPCGCKKNFEYTQRKPIPKQILPDGSRQPVAESRVLANYNYIINNYGSDGRSGVSVI
jgi:hypothetical protein